jgi:hypothetical protein
MSETVDFPIQRGGDYLLRFRLVSPPSSEVGAVTTWTTQFQVRTARGSSTVLTVAGAVSTITGAETVGVFDVTLTAAQTTALTRSTYFYAFVRTDTGYSDALTTGKLNVEDY